MGGRFAPASALCSALLGLAISLACSPERKAATAPSESSLLGPTPVNGTATSGAGPPLAAASAPSLSAGGAGVVRGRRGMVVSVEANATRAGARVLEMGGNAMDAAVATAYALAVTHPSAGNIGGGGFMLVARRGDPIVALDFRERAPGATNAAAFDAMLESAARGPAASAVPGSVAGLNLASSRFGRLPLSEVLAPAIELARSGHALGARQALVLGWAWPELSRDAAASRIFGSRGAPLREGDWLVQHDLAETLERIQRHGDAGFYAGATARALILAMGSTGLIRQRDLGSYRAILREPLGFAYRGFDVATMPPPSSGGVAVAMILLGLESLGAARLPAWSADELHLFAEVSKRAQARRRFGLVDPDSAPLTMSAAGLREWLTPLGFAGTAPPIDPDRATPASRVHPSFGALERELEHTTHLSVVDAEGNAVSCTTTLSGSFGARYVAAGTGIVMNNSLAAFGRLGLNLPRGGRRMLSSMAPTLVTRGAEVVAVLGSPGGDTIPSTIVQVLRNLVDHGLSIEAAIEAPRVHHGFVPDELRVERERPLAPGVLAALKARGHVLGVWNAPIGDANGIAVVSGVAYGHADTREGGLALGPEDVPR